MNFTLGIQGVKIQIAHPPEPVKSLADQNEGEGGIRRALALRIEIQTNSALFFLTPSLVPICKWLTVDCARDYNTNKKRSIKKLYC